MQDVLRREEKAKGKEARQHLQFILLTTEQLDDVMAALAFLKSVPGVDPQRIAVVGHSFGGQLTLLAAERDKICALRSHSAELRVRGNVRLNYASD
jgi:dienelactone hydrolase